MTAAASADLLALLAQAEAARDAGTLIAGLAAAERAWGLADEAAPDLRLRVGRLLLHFRYRSGALWALVDDGLRVLPLMRDSRVPVGELIDTLRMVVLGAADVGRFEEAMALGHEAHRLALEANDRPRLSLAINALGCVFERIGDPWHAERLLLDALAQARDCADRHATSAALNNLMAINVGAFYLLHDSADPGEAQRLMQRSLPYAEEAMAMAEAMSDPFYQAFVRGNRGEVLTHLGRLDEARPDIEASAALCRDGGFDAQAWRIACSMGELLLREGRPAQALQQLQAALQASAEADARMTRLRLHHAAWRAAREVGQTQQALDHLEQYQRLERARMLSQLRGRSQLFVTTVEAEQVRLEARRAGERAVRAEVSARVDQLTGLGNRRELEQRWPPMVQRLADGQLPLAMAMLDLDHFKQVNDRFGHAVGDAVLVALAKLLRDNTRDDDLIIRTGGEEFLLVLPEVDLIGALHVCDRMRQRVAAHGWELLCPSLQVTVSVGLTAAPPYEQRTLIQRADAALYEAKRTGRNRVHTG